MFARDRITGATGSLVTGSTFVGRHYGRISKTIEVQTTTLDAVLDRCESPDLVKIDVEQAEDLVLASARRVLDRQPILLYECAASKREAIKADLMARGYELLDAEGYGSSEQISSNVLAWPPRLSSQLDALVAAWQARRFR